MGTSSTPHCPAQLSSTHPPTTTTHPRFPSPDTHSMDNSRAKCHPSQDNPCAHWRPPPRRGPAAPNEGVTHCWGVRVMRGGGSAGAHLVLAGPEQADGQLCLVPLAAVGAGGIPDGAAHRAPRHPDVGAEGARAVAVPAVHEVAELEAVGVILAQRLEKQVSFLAWSVLRGVHHQVGACGRREKWGKAWSNPPALYLLSFAGRVGEGGGCGTAKMRTTWQRCSGPAGYLSICRTMRTCRTGARDLGWNQYQIPI